MTEVTTLLTAETEAELAFSALADLPGPALGYLDAQPALQAAVLMGALGLSRRRDPSR